MANTVALKGMSDVPGVRVTMDISKEREITVQDQDKVYKFKEWQDGLYYYDTTNGNSISDATNKSNASITPC